ncbi:MAG: biopolymer transporter ExbD [Pseudomonadales bacterium]|nr:biopolymer transporter ExbD [Pseudomonadales bacterium]NRA13995.1 biopolymer transporter ExbD [Oceanospirillaceae bacterium]
MKFKRRVRQDIDVNMTPLIDVVFLLLIFFMVSTTFTKESRLGINLPEASPSEQISANDYNLEVLIDANGIFKVANITLGNNDLSTIRAALQTQLQSMLRAAKTDINPSLTITADAATAHQFVVSTMDIAGQLGFSKLQITTLTNETQ